MKRALGMTAVAALSILLTATAQAGARHPASAKANTFSGRCSLTGQVVFSPALTNTSQAIVQYANATGTCTGTFTGRTGKAHQLNNAPVSYRATEYAQSASCNLETDSGSGSITFAYGTIAFTISETRASGAAAVTLNGAKGGSAAGQANVSTSANPITLMQACAGAGMGGAPIQAEAATTPSISG